MSLQSSFRKLVKATLNATVTEWNAVLQQENTLKYSMNSDQGRLRGIKLKDLELSDVELNEKKSELEIHLNHDYPIESTSRAFRQGKLVDLICANNGNGNNNKSWMRVKGIVSKIDSSSISIQVQSMGDNFLLSSILNKSKNKSTYIDLERRCASNIMQICAKNIKKLKLKSESNSDIAAALTQFPSINPEQKRKLTPIFCDYDFLDDDKRECVSVCSMGHPITIIHGPPGTGKTTALASVILSFLANGLKVLATAPSHAAVDALLLAIAKQWNEDVLNVPTNKMLRIGNILRLKDPRSKNWLPKTTGEYEDCCQNLQQLRQDLLLGSKGKKILIESEAKLVEKLKSISRKSEFAQISNSNIVVTTCLSAIQWPDKVKKNFDLIVIDEAAFAPDWLTMPLALSGIKQLILAGDHCQLPPVVVSDTDCQSLMERLMIHNDMIPTVFLSQQFRSNKLISNWSNGYFYQNRLKSWPHVESICLQDLLEDHDQKQNSKFLQQSLVFIDTSHQQGYQEIQDDYQDGSVCNEKEAQMVYFMVKKLVNLGIRMSDIGIITPYWSQVALLRDMVKDLPNIEISTVDGFQGSEKELIVVSFVRSNSPNVVGFLNETRRINVTITRAKRMCIAIGDISTLESDPGINDFIKYCYENNAVVKVSECHNLF